MFSADLKQWTDSAATPTRETSSSDPADYEVVSMPLPATVPVEGGGPDQEPQFFGFRVSSN